VTEDTTALGALILGLLATRPHSAPELSRLLIERRSQVLAALWVLLADGRVHQEGWTKGTTWALGPPSGDVQIARTRKRLGRKAERLCTRCRVRWVQDRGALGALCRRCGRETGSYQLLTLERDRVVVERQTQQVDALRQATQTAFDVRTIVSDGVEYEAVSVGKLSLTGEYPSASSLLTSHRLAW
jgi:hypothetical protein